MKSTIALIWFHNFLRSAAHFASWEGKSASFNADDIDDIVEIEDIDDIDDIVEPEDIDDIILFWSWDGWLWYY